MMEMEREKERGVVDVVYFTFTYCLRVVVMRGGWFDA